MNGKTNIEWTDCTWNPVRGCNKISPGCAHCYAETFAERFRGVPNHPYTHGFDLRLVPSRLADPLLLSSSRRIFTNSMSDLFHADVPEHFIHRVARVMVASPWHQFQVLTKRAERMCQMLNSSLGYAAAAPHIFWGVSVENRRHGLPRLDALKNSAAIRRFASIEPLLESLSPFSLAGIDWAIVGGESGPGARPMDPDWVRQIRDHCVRQSIAFHFKQWGGAKKKTAGRTLDGRTWDDRPPLPTITPPTLAQRKGILAELSAAGIL